MRCVAIIFYQLRSNVLLNAQRLGPAADGAALYTPGLSERRNGSSLFYNSDNLGNLWSVEDSTGQAEAGAYLFTGFGAPTYTGSGSGSDSPLKYGGANGCQTDGDTGLVLMGHRYYDTRIGRFISQDPAGDGDNWYAYADNSPTNEVDPTGLSTSTFIDPSMAGAQYEGGGVSFSYMQDNYGTYDIYQQNSNGSSHYLSTFVNEPSMFDQMSMGGGGMGPGMIAGNPANTHESVWHYLMRQFMSGGNADGHHLGPPPFASAGPGMGAKGYDSNTPIGKQLEGKGQLSALRSNPNLQKGVNLEELLTKTPDQLRQMQSNGEVSSKTVRLIFKAFEGRKLN